MAQESDSKWYFEASYSLTDFNGDWNFDFLDSSFQFENPSFKVLGIGGGYQINPSLSVEARYRQSNSWDGAAAVHSPLEGDLEGYAVTTSTALFLEWNSIESYVVYNFAPNATASFHIKGGWQLTRAPATMGLVSIIYEENDGSVRDILSDGFADTVEGSSVLGGFGVTFMASPRVSVRAEYLLEDASPATSLSGSVLIRF